MSAPSAFAFAGFRSEWYPLRGSILVLAETPPISRSKFNQEQPRTTKNWDIFLLRGRSEQGQTIKAKPEFFLL
eukprot:scaffold14139_cov74-Cyclotella_meneghiniana.AAC.17